MKIYYSEEQFSKTEYKAVKAVASFLQFISYLSAVMTFILISVMGTAMGGLFGNSIGSPIGFVVGIFLSLIPLVLIQAMAQLLLILREIAINTRK